MKLEVGMYVRTKWGITQYKEYETSMGKLLCMPLMNGTFANIEDILKASHTLLGNDKEPCLIEPGDYVNGVMVTEIKDGKPFKEDYNDPYYSYYFDDIYSIVTKEQFESISYKMED